MDGHIRDLTLSACGGLVDHDFGIGQSHTLALGTCAQQKRTHGGGHAHTDGGNIALDILHGVIDGHASRDAAAGAVNVKLNILVRILCLQIQQLRHNQGSRGIIDLFGQENNAVIQQTGENIIAALAAAGLLNNIGNQTHGDVSFQGFETF